jgi:hypothetical protein
MGRTQGRLHVCLNRGLPVSDTDFDDFDVERAMTAAEMELELARLRDALAQVSAQGEAQRRTARQFGYINLAVALGFWMLSLVLYLNHVAAHQAYFLSAIVLICLSASMTSLAGPRPARRASPR